MKISFNPAFSYTQAQKINNKEQKVTNPNQNINEIQRNSMAEALGRSQTVSFGATNRMQGPIFEHICKEKFGLGEKDVIKYNKENGSLRHEIYDSAGDIIQIQEFFPMEGSEILTEYDDDGSKTITTTTPDSEQIEKYDSRGRQTFLRNENVNGNKYQTDIDYRRQRKVIREQGPYSAERITVIDLRTQQAVTSGDLVIDTRYDKSMNANVTENILTKQVLRLEYKRQNGQTDRIIDYVEGSGLIAREKSFDAKTGLCTEVEYTGWGRNPAVRLTKTSRDGRTKQIIEYEPDGRTVKSNILYGTLRNGNLDYKVVYSGGSDKVVYKEHYYDTTYSRVFYREQPNIPGKEEVYTSQGDRLVQETFFYDDGKTKHVVNDYEKDGSYREYTYTTRGKAKLIKSFSPTGFLRSEEHFDTKTGKIISARDYNEKTGYYQDTFYNPETQEIQREIKYSRQGNVLEDTEYFQDGTTPKHHIKYNFDGSYTETFYYEDGQVRSSQEYDSNGRRKTANRRAWNWDWDNQGSSYQQQRTNSTGSTGSTSATSSQRQGESEAAFLNRIGSIAANKDRSIILEFQTSDWERLGKIIDIDDVTVIKNMDQKTYRKLAMTFHPDRVAQESQEVQDRHSKIFQIITAIHNRNK